MRKSSRIIWIALIGLSLSGILGVLVSTRWGVGMTPDAVVYLDSARHLASGRGLSTSVSSQTDEPMTLFAPFYPVLLSLTTHIGLDPIASARWLNAAVFGLNILLIGLMFLKTVPTPAWIPVAGAFLALTSETFLILHSMAWSEPVFILFYLLTLQCLGGYLEGGRLRLLIASAAWAGLAMLTRYAGLSLVAIGIGGIALLGTGNNRQKVRDGFVFCFVSCLPTLVWLIHNMSLAGTATNRQLVFHPVSLDKLKHVATTFANWLLLSRSSAAWLKGIFAGVMLASFLLIAIEILKESRLSRSKTAPVGQPKTPRLIHLLALSIPAYFAFLLLSISFFDANTPLDYRILSPAFAASLALSIYFAARLVSRKANLTASRILLAVVIMFSIASAIKAFQIVNTGYLMGWGYNSASWHESGLLAELKRTPESTPFFSNAPEAIYVQTGRSARILPFKLDPRTGLINPSFPSEMAELKSQVQKQGGLVVYFNSVTRGYLPTENELKYAIPLKVQLQSNEGTIYTGAP